MVRRLLLALPLAAAFSVSAIAQVQGRLSGTVVDPTGAPVPNAEVKLFLQGGQSAVVSARSNEVGVILFVAIRPESYDISIEAPGFRKEMIRAVKIDPAQETPLGTVTLEVGSVTEVVEVAATAQAVQISNAEISTTLTNEQLRRLPTINRNPIALLYTQAGISSTNRSNTVINGLRTSYTNMTLDGVNIQDNFIRANAIDFQPNLLLLDQIAEANIGVSNNNSGLGGGANQINFVTPSGTNTLKTTLF
jgi:hypothetical protein